MSFTVTWENSQNLDSKQVKLNAEKILATKTSNRFRKFVKSHKDEIFTAKDAKAGTKATGMMYELEEDETVPKWLFYVDDLILVE